MRRVMAQKANNYKMRSSIRTAIRLSLLLALGTSGPALAQTADFPPMPDAPQNEAPPPKPPQSPEDQLREIVQTILDRQAERISNNLHTGAKLEMDGPLDIEQVDNYYAITLPLLSLHYKGGQKIQIGMLSINALPAEKPGQWKMTLALPTPMIGFDTKGVETIRITFGEQKIAGLWDSSINNFTKLDATIKNLNVNFPANQGFSNAEGFLIRYNLETENGQSWSGPAYFETTGASWSLPNAKTQGRAARLSLSAEIDHYTPQPGAVYDLFFSPQMLASPRTIKDIQGLKAELGAQNLDLTLQQQANPAHYTLQNASLKLDKSEQETMDLGAQLDFNALTYEGADHDLAALLPSSGHIVLANKNLPIKPALSTLGNDPAMSALTIPMLIANLPEMLSDAGTYVQTENSSLHGKDYKLDLDAIIRADKTAINKMRGEGHAAFTGLDTVLAALQVAATNQSLSLLGPVYKNMAAALEKLKEVGRIEADKDNNFVHKYDVILDPSGLLLINGKSYSEIMNPDKPVKPPAPVAQPQ